MAWGWPGDKLLSEPTWLVYWRIYESLGLNDLIVPYHAYHMITAVAFV